MRLHRALAATSAVLFVVVCSTRPEISTPPRAGTPVGPQEKPAQPSHEEGPALPPQTGPPPAATAPLPARNRGPAKDKPPAPPDPYTGIDAERMSLYEQAKGLLEPIVKGGQAVVQAGFQPRLSEDEQRTAAVLRLGRYKVSLNRDAETRLRALLAGANDTEAAIERYLAAVDLMVAGPEKGYTLAAAYERAIDDGADIPAEARRALAELVRAKDPQEAPQDTRGIIGQGTESLRAKLLEQSVKGDDLFELALIVHRLGQAVIEKRQRSRTFHGLVMGLPEPHRTDVLMQIAWSPAREAAHDWEREKLKTLDLSRPMMVSDEERAAYAKGLEAIAAERREGFLALEQARRDTIEGCFHDVDAPGWQALVALDALLAGLQAVVDATLPDLMYRFRPLIPAGAPRDAASNVLSKVPLPGSVEDRVPTIRVSDDQIVFDAPAGRPPYADVVKPGNVLVGTFRLKDPFELGEPETTYQAELHIEAVEKQVVQGELVVGGPPHRRESIPFRGEVGPTGFSFEVAWEWELGPSGVGTFVGSLDKGGPLTGEVLHSFSPVGSFSFALEE